MQEKTKADYRKLATYSYATHIPGQPPSPKRIKDALAKFAPECRPNYWLRLRGAVVMLPKRNQLSNASVAANFGVWPVAAV